MAANPYTGDQSPNTLHLLRGDWSTLTSGISTLLSEKGIVGLQSLQGNASETECYRAKVAIAVGSNLITA